MQGIPGSPRDAHGAYTTSGQLAKSRAAAFGAQPVINNRELPLPALPNALRVVHVTNSADAEFFGGHPGSFDPVFDLLEGDVAGVVG
jgi:hypothetical protein